MYFETSLKDHGGIGFRILVFFFCSFFEKNINESVQNSRGTFLCHQLITNSLLSLFGNCSVHMPCNCFSWMSSWGLGTTIIQCIHRLFVVLISSLSVVNWHHSGLQTTDLIDTICGLNVVLFCPDIDHSKAHLVRIFSRLVFSLLWTTTL